jgi:hypothetical protein
VAHGPGCAPESALRVFGFLAQLWSSCCTGSKAGWGRLSSYARNYRSWGARLRAAQSGRFELWFPLVGLPAVRHKHNLKMSRLSWARVPNKVGWLVATELWLTTVWSLGRADHSHPSKHTLRYSIYIHTACIQLLLITGPITLQLLVLNQMLKR